MLKYTISRITYYIHFQTIGSEKYSSWRRFLCIYTFSICKYRCSYIPCCHYPLTPNDDSVSTISPTPDSPSIPTSINSPANASIVKVLVLFSFASIFIGTCPIPTNASMVNNSLIVPFNIVSTFTLLVNVGSINASTINVSIFLFSTFESTIIILNGKNNLESTVNTFVFACSENVSITNVSTPVFLTKASTSISSNTPISLTTASTILVSSILSANNASDVKFFVFLARNKLSLRHLEF